MKPDESWRRDLFPLRKGRGLGVVNSNIDMGGGELIYMTILLEGVAISGMRTFVLLIFL